MRLARLLLALYPRAFRRHWGDAYLEAAKHRLRLERSRRPAGASTRAAWVLLLDAARSLPAEWREALGGRGTETTTRDVMGGGRMTGVEGWIWDIRIALRSVARRPTVSVLVVGTLALGTGANAAIFGALNRLVLSPLPFEGADRAAYIMSRLRAGDFTFSITPEEYERYRQGSTSFERIEVFQPTGGLLAREETLEQLDGAGVSVGLAGMIGAAPVLGRTFNEEDAVPAAEPVVMLSERYWRSKMGGDAGVIGSTVTISDVNRTVVGIWPAAGRFRAERDPDFFTPLTRGEEIDRSYFSIAMGMLAHGVDRDEAAAELDALRQGMEDEAAASADRHETPLVLPVHHFVADSFIQALWILFAGVGLLLAVAGVNAAGLLLNRAVDRGQELGVRMALGGSATRMLRHFFLEGAILSSAGAALGVGVAQLGTWWLARLAPPQLPASAREAGAGELTGYILVLVVALTLVCTVVPALHLRTSEVRTLVRRGVGSSSRRLQRLRGGLVAGQVALAAILVVGSGLALRSLGQLQAMDFGFEARKMGIVTVRYPVGAYTEPGEREAAASRVREELAALPSVTDASVSSVLPLSYSIRFGVPDLDGHQPPVVEEGAYSQSATSSSGFLTATGIPLLEGRDFTDVERRDPAAHRVVLVNHGFAARYRTSVVGRSLLFPGDTVGRLIVGVVGDVRSGNLTDETVRPQVYHPSDGVSGSSRAQRYLLRLAAGTAVPHAAIHERVRSVDPTLRVQGIDVGAEMVAERSAPNRFLAVILSLLGALSLTLALGGVYGAVTLHVARRTREMGIRIALGALPSRVKRGVVLRGMRPVAVGLVVGLAFAAAAAGYISGVLYQVSPWDPVSFGVAVLVLLGAAVFAAHVPARRAARVDPTESLRAE